MSRRFRALLGIGLTVGITLVLAWIAVQFLVIRPAIGDREPVRAQVVLEAAELMRSGVSKKEIEDRRGIDLRIFQGRPTAPPPGDGWNRLETPEGSLWKRDGGKYEIAAWTGAVWVVLHEDFPFASTLTLTFFAMGLPIVILMFGLTQRSQRHQERAEATLARIAEGELHERLDEDVGGREGRRMAAAVNRMASTLQALLESDRQRAAGLSHELRTPLTRIRLELELARREGASVERLDRVERDIEVFDEMLTEMLELSRLQLVGAQLATREAVDLAGLAHWVTDEEGWNDIDIRGVGTAHVDRKLVARLLRNLLRNSLQHAPTADRWIAVTDDELQVGDDGPGIPESRHPSVLQAFQRGDTSGGHGLGLAIVAQIAALHGGTVALSKPPGLVVTIRFDRP